MEQMWLFEDRGGRECCLIPEATALFQEMASSMRGERKFFYVARCYRYERPQEGRYREFTQLGAEILNPKAGPQEASAQAMLDCQAALRALGVDPGSLQWDAQAKRGLGYYLQGQGFEARCESLGASKQLAGGGPYAEGAGFAIGLDRALMAASR
jgi:histidyl-tRNA synthetase